MELAWNLNELYNSNEQFDADFKKLKDVANKIIATKGTLNNASGLLQYYKLAEEYGKIQEKMVNYLFFMKSLDGSNIFAIEKLAEIENYVQKFHLETTFIMKEIKKIPNASLKEWAKLKEFKDYDNDILDIIKIKKHTLPVSQEKLMINAGFSTSHEELFDCLDNVELKFGYVKNEKGERVELTNSNYHSFASNVNKEIRKPAILKMYKAFGSVNQTLATNYISHLKYNDFVAKAYKYKSTQQMCLFGDDLPFDLPQIVVKNITKHLPKLHEYYAWRKSFMNLNKFESCDLSCKLFDKSVSNEYELTEAIDIIKKALYPLGESYTKMLDEAVDKKWIDSRLLQNKNSGAYCADVYNVHPYILLSYDKTQNSISTLAHEFGHAMHTYYSQKYQPYAKANYSIFVAEVASTVNELLLADYFIKNSKTKEQQIANITELLRTFIATTFTQTEYTEFEIYVHDAIDNGEPLSYNKLNEYYLNLQKKYCGKGVNVLDTDKYHWSRIPHFYSDFYVFKYVTGWVAACAIVEKLKTEKDYVNKYIKFLSSGSSRKPCDLLKIADIDILNQDTYNKAFKLFNKYLQILQN